MHSEICMSIKPGQKGFFLSFVVVEGIKKTFFNLQIFIRVYRVPLSILSHFARRSLFSLILHNFVTFLFFSVMHASCPLYNLISLNDGGWPFRNSEWLIKSPSSAPINLLRRIPGGCPARPKIYEPPTARRS